MREIRAYPTIRLARHAPSPPLRPAPLHHAHLRLVWGVVCEVVAGGDLFESCGESGRGFGEGGVKGEAWFREAQQARGLLEVLTNWGKYYPCSKCGGEHIPGVYRWKYDMYRGELEKCLRNLRAS